MADQSKIRNFSIIAHIDHGKSTLADRILEMTQTVQTRDMRAQLLDSMDLERERGITIKAQAVRVNYTARDGETYQFHLIDTPGHVDFTYEVSRSLAACEGALLVVDASQGVEAQTVANTYLAIHGGLELIPCLNKVDLPGAEPERVAEEVADLIGEPTDDIRRISAKTGEGVTDVLEELVARVPPPAGDPGAPPRALIFDSEFDQYRGVVAYIRVVDGTFKKGEAIRAMAAGTEADIDDIGFFTPAQTPAEQLVDALAGLGRDPADGLGLLADQLGDLPRHPLGLRARQVELVHARDQLEAAVDRQVRVGDGLGLDALRGVDQEERAVARGERARDLVGEVHVPGRVDQVEAVELPVAGGVGDPHRLGLDRDAALALELHRVQHLGAHGARVDGVGHLQDAIGQRGLPVVDVGDDREVADVCLVHGSSGLPEAASQRV